MPQRRSNPNGNCSPLDAQVTRILADLRATAERHNFAFDAAEEEAWLREFLAAPERPPLRLPQLPLTGSSMESTERRTQLVMTRMSSVEAEKVEWLWKARIPLGKITICDGDPGLGKSLITLDLAARVSRGGIMPDDTAGLLEPRTVLLLSAEDALGDTVRPRLEAAGADCSRIHAIESIRNFRVNNEGAATEMDVEPDLGAADALREAILRESAALVVVDPLMAYLPPNVDAHRDQDVRRILRPLAKVAEETGAAILLIRHLCKTAGRTAIYRGGGSIGIIGAARTGLLVARDPRDPEGKNCILAVVKSNLAEHAPSLCYTVTQTATGACRVTWGETTDQAANDLLVPILQSGQAAQGEAEEFLRATLAEGPIASQEVLEGGELAGIARRTLYRAKQRLGVVSRKTAVMGNWVWELPDESPKPPKVAKATQGCQTNNLATLGDAWQSSDQQADHEVPLRPDQEQLRKVLQRRGWPRVDAPGVYGCGPGEAEWMARLPRLSVVEVRFIMESLCQSDEAQGGEV